MENTTNLSDPTDKYSMPSAFGSVSKTRLKMPVMPLLVSLKKIQPESGNTLIATGKGTFQMEDLLGLGMESKQSLNIAFTDLNLLGLGMEPKQSLNIAFTDFQ